MIGWLTGFVTVLLMVVAWAGSPGVAEADTTSDCLITDCTDTFNAGVAAQGDSYRITLWSVSGESHEFSVGDNAPRRHHYAWSWVPTCLLTSSANPDGMCAAAANTCVTVGDIQFRVYYRDLDVANDPWHLSGTQCLGPDPTLPLAEARGQVERAFRDLPLVAGSLRVQPSGNAIVNLPTIFYADTPERLTFALSAVGRSVTLTATPRTWSWHWGDGEPDGVSREPGAPYPHETVTHRYRAPMAAPVWVTVEWGATYRIGGVDRTFSVARPVSVQSRPVPVTVREARSELVAGG